MRLLFKSVNDLNFTGDCSTIHRAVEDQIFMKRVVLSVSALLAVLAVFLGAISPAYACSNGQQSCSTGPTGYGVSEVFFGTGGELNTCSTGPTGYCAKTAVGETGVGLSCPTGPNKDCIQAGYNTDRQPSLTFIVGAPATPNLGYLNTGNVATDYATFSVQTYLASGYIVQAYGSPTSNGNPHVLTPITTPGGATSAPGTEQFGMNLVVNTSPVVGVAAACQTPSFCTLGTIASNYANANKFYYTSGDAIVTGSSSTGQTNYTISYIFNISGATPDGTYTLNQSLVATSTF